MKVKALISFSDSVHGTRAGGDVFELPEGADWLRAEFGHRAEADRRVVAADEPVRLRDRGGQLEAHANPHRIDESDKPLLTEATTFRAVGPKR